MRYVAPLTRTVLSRRPNSHGDFGPEEIRDQVEIAGRILRLSGFLFRSVVRRGEPVFFWHCAACSMVSTTPQFLCFEADRDGTPKSLEAIGIHLCDSRHCTNPLIQFFLELLQSSCGTANTIAEPFPFGFESYLGRPHNALTLDSLLFGHTFDPAVSVVTLDLALPDLGEQLMDDFRLDLPHFDLYCLIDSNGGAPGNPLRPLLGEMMTLFRVLE